MVTDSGKSPLKNRAQGGCESTTLTLSSPLYNPLYSVRRHRPSTKSLRPTSAFRGTSCTALLAGIMLATPELATVPRATCEAQVKMESLSG